MKYLLLAFGVLLIFAGYRELKNGTPEVSIENKKVSKKTIAIFDFFLNGGISGIGQILGGIVCIIIFVLTFFLK